MELSIVVDDEAEHGEGRWYFIFFEGGAVIEYVFELLAVIYDFCEYFGQFYVFKHRNNIEILFSALRLNWFSSILVIALLIADYGCYEIIMNKKY